MVWTSATASNHASTRIMTKLYGPNFKALARKYSDVILASWHGHLHDDTFRLQMDSDGTAYGVQLCVPSVTTWTQENPRVRLIEYDDESFEVHKAFPKSAGRQQPRSAALPTPQAGMAARRATSPPGHGPTRRGPTIVWAMQPQHMMNTPVLQAA